MQSIGRGCKRQAASILAPREHASSLPTVPLLQWHALLRNHIAFPLHPETAPFCAAFLTTEDLQHTMLFSFFSPSFLFFFPLLDTLLRFFLPSHFLYHQMKAIQTKTVQSALCVWKTEHQRQLDLPEMATAVATVALC